MTACWLSTFRRAHDLILLWKNTHAIASRYRGSSLKQFVSTRFFTWIISIRSIIRNEAPLSELFSMCEDETMEHTTQWTRIKTDTFGSRQTQIPWTKIINQ